MYIKDREGDPEHPTRFLTKCRGSGVFDGLSKINLRCMAKFQGRHREVLGTLPQLSQGELRLLVHRRGTRDLLPEGYNGGWRSFQTPGGGDSFGGILTKDL